MSGDKQIVPVNQPGTNPVPRPKVGAQLKALAEARKRKESASSTPGAGASTQPSAEKKRKRVAFTSAGRRQPSPPRPRSPPSKQQAQLESRETRPVGASSSSIPKTNIFGKITAEFQHERDFLRSQLRDYIKTLEAVVEGDVGKESSGVDYFSDIVQDFQNKTAMVGLDAFMQCNGFLAGLKEFNPIPVLQEEVQSLQSRVSSLSADVESKSRALSKGKARLVRAQAKRAEAEKKLAEETRRLADKEQALSAKVLDLEGQIERMRAGEGLDAFELIDTPAFVEVQDAWNAMALEKFRRALHKFHPSLDQSFLDDGVPEVDEEVEIDAEAEGSEQLEKSAEADTEDGSAEGEEVEGGGEKADDVEKADVPEPESKTDAPESAPGAS